MARFTLVLLLLTVAACSASQSRIVGGQLVPIEKHPSIVQIVGMVLPGVWTQVCGGSILTSRYVLSAARCFRTTLVFGRQCRILAGSSRHNRGIASLVATTHIHPSFNENTGYDGDIALALLVTPMRFSSSIQPVAIIGQGVTIPDNIPVIQAGFGSNLEGLGHRFSDLRELTVYTVNREQCARNYASNVIPRTVTKNMICAGDPQGGIGACIGDNGGPLYFNNIVVGVISWGWGCTNATFPRVHTAVSSYTDWIVQTAV